MSLKQFFSQIYKFDPTKIKMNELLNRPVIAVLANA
jgi:hypothetical protein